MNEHNVDPAARNRLAIQDKARERNGSLRGCHYVWRPSLTGVSVALLSAVLVACGGGTANPTGQASQASIDPTADRPADGQVVRTCGSHYAADFDRGVESRVVAAGPVSLVGFRVSLAPGDEAPVRAFKVMVRLTAGTEAKIETTTDGTSLLYDRARFTTRNVYSLSDGEHSVRFTGCPDRSAVFNGAVLTTGPRAVDLKITVDGHATPVQVHAYEG